MKRIVAILLTLTMILPLLVSCKVDLEDKGAIIPVYLSAAQENLDPSVAIYDKDFYHMSGLLYDTLTEVSGGKLRLNLIDSWQQKYNEERDEYFITIKLVSTKWNDGRILTADHVVYALKRAVSPEVNCPAAALLYDVKNARAIKAGEKTIDDLGVAAVNISTLEVQFEKPIQPELFLEVLSSPTLVPLRDDVVVGKEDKWATNVDDIATNGKFTIKSMNPKGSYRFDFSKYYRLDAELKKGYNEFVSPYRLITNYELSSEQALAAFDNGEIFYYGDITPELYQERAKQIKSSDTLSSYTYYFNCENKTLADKRVRQALSEALDRTAIAELVGMGSTAAAGFVSPSASGSSMGKSFRKEAGAVYSAAANTEKAQSLLKEAGVSSGSFRLTYRKDRAYEEAVAQYAKTAWEALGFKVSLDGVDAKHLADYVNEGSFDVIGLDFTGLSTNPYSFLAPFAPSYSGSIVSVDAESSGVSPHVTHFASDEYEAKLDQILDTLDRKTRNQLLIELEKMFVEECPAASLVNYKHNYLASSDLSGLSANVYGYTEFTRATLKDYKTRNTAFEEALEALEDASR
ncbi:MAG: hypothetical protein II776_06315 [Clostridia bacterium]|nr:hypothetical protein [Clostridia bacterium]